MLYALPIGDLRRCVATLVADFPESLRRPMGYLEKCRSEIRDSPLPYPGDLEADFFGFLGRVQKAGREEPANTEADFKKER